MGLLAVLVGEIIAGAAFGVIWLTATVPRYETITSEHVARLTAVLMTPGNGFVWVAYLTMTASLIFAFWLFRREPPGGMGFALKPRRVWWIAVLVSVGVGAFAPIPALSAVCEETALRGYAFTAIKNKRSALIITSALSGLLFSGSYAPSALVIAIAAGLVCGILRIRTGSLWVPIAAHVLLKLLLEVLA